MGARQTFMACVWRVVVCGRDWPGIVHWASRDLERRTSRRDAGPEAAPVLPHRGLHELALRPQAASTLEPVRTGAPAASQVCWVGMGGGGGGGVDPDSAQAASFAVCWVGGVRWWWRGSGQRRFEFLQRR